MLISLFDSYLIKSMQKFLVEIESAEIRAVGMYPVTDIYNETKNGL